MLSTKKKELVLPGEAPPRLRYSPLPCLDVGDYVEKYGGHLHQTGVFDYLSTSGSGLDLDDVRRMDLSALGVLGSAFFRSFSSDGGVKPIKPRDLIFEHCKLFKVQVYIETDDDWLALDSAEAINAHLDFGHAFDLVRALGGEALRPLWSRLVSSGEARPSESATTSTEPSPES